MTARLLADVDLRFSIVTGLRLRAPGIDFLASHGTIPEGVPDPLVLRIAQELGRVLVSHDRSTMPRHFREFVSQSPSPGLILIPQTRSTRYAIEHLEMALLCMPAEDFRNQIYYL